METHGTERLRKRKIFSNKFCSVFNDGFMLSFHFILVLMLTMSILGAMEKLLRTNTLVAVKISKHLMLMLLANKKIVTRR